MHGIDMTTAVAISVLRTAASFLPSGLKNDVI